MQSLFQKHGSVAENTNKAEDLPKAERPGAAARAWPSQLARKPVPDSQGV